MKTTATTLSVAIPLALLALTTVAAGAAGPFLTEPSTAAPLEIATSFLDSHQSELGLAPGDLADTVVKNQYATRHNGVTHIYLKQRLGGVEVVNAILGVHVMPDGRILHLTNRFVSELGRKAENRAPMIQPEEAIARAAEHLGIETARTPVLLETIGGPALKARFDDAGISREDIPVELMYLPLPDGRVRLVWAQVIQQIDTPDYWHLFTDAETGEVLDKINWTANESYEVFALPKDSPYDGPRTIEVDPYLMSASPLASPFGWHDTNGAAGAEFTDTRGNNVEAQTDLDANNSFTPGTDVRAEGGAGLAFTGGAVPLDLNQEPDTYLEAAVANLFYYNNIMHDLTYHYGFDEAAGNFQSNNYGRGGLGNDEVLADAQDGSGTNNANFATPPDGSSGRMQMYIWTNPFAQLVTVNSPAGIAGSYVANPSNNGGTGVGLTADINIVQDTTPPTNDGCETIVNDLTGKFALILWNQGQCNSSVFVQNAADAGAIGAIMIDNTDDPYTNFGGSNSIPSVAVGLSDGMLIMNTIIGGDTVNATFELNTGADPNRDSDLDNGIISHEYGHGISNRLVGGPSTTGCLSNSEQMGEGLSDWWTLVLSAVPGQTAEQTRGVGNYASFRPVGDLGIRNFPYTTNMTINPQTYEDIGGTNAPHGVGEIWNAMAWEVYWNIVTSEGFDPDLYNGTGGNNTAIQLMIDGMKMVNCSPTFVDLRDAILAADVANYGGAHECEIWLGFAKRGLGFSANAGSNSRGDETEAFDLPPGLDPNCLAGIFSDGFESGDISAWSGSVVP